MRIVSLVPSLTETLFDFGLTADEVVGRTKFCIHPHQKISEVTVVGGTKNIHPERIAALAPDLIIANKEENDRLQIENLSEKFRVWVTDIKNLEDNSNFLVELGRLLNKKEKALYFIDQIDSCLPESPQLKKAAYLIWQKPYLTVGQDTFIHEIMLKAGFKNIFGELTRYPEIDLNAVAPAEIILLSTEPFPFQEKHISEFRKLFPSKKIMLVDGEAFSWYGTHLAHRKQYFEKLSREIRG